jgi:hypothetical protein
MSDLSPKRANCPYSTQDNRSKRVCAHDNGSNRCGRPVEELVSISVIASLGLVMAWAQAADLFAICFAAAAAIAIVEAARRSV